MTSGGNGDAVCRRHGAIRRRAPHPRRDPACTILPPWRGRQASPRGARERGIAVCSPARRADRCARRDPPYLRAQLRWGDRHDDAGEGRAVPGAARGRVLHPRQCLGCRQRAHPRLARLRRARQHLGRARLHARTARRRGGGVARGGDRQRRRDRARNGAAGFRRPRGRVWRGAGGLRLHGARRCGSRAVRLHDRGHDGRSRASDP